MPQSDPVAQDPVVADHGGTIHETNPFATPSAMRDPVRRLRGRMPAPVTIVTAGDGPHRTGLTVSSLVVAEGTPGLAYCLIGPTSDFLDVVAADGRFLIHVCEMEHRAVADVFAGLRPSPGGLFVDREFTQTAYGPRLAGFATVAECTFLSGREESYSTLVTARIDTVEAGNLDDPLLYFRGAYRRLDPG